MTDERLAQRVGPDALLGAHRALSHGMALRLYLGWGLTTLGRYALEHAPTQVLLQTDRAAVSSAPVTATSRAPAAAAREVELQGTLFPETIGPGPNAATDDRLPCLAGVTWTRAAEICLRRAGRPLGIGEILRRIIEAGFVCETENTRVSLTGALHQHQGDVFVRLARGVYGLRRWLNQGADPIARDRLEREAAEERTRTLEQLRREQARAPKKRPAGTLSLTERRLLRQLGRRGWLDSAGVRGALDTRITPRAALDRLIERGLVRIRLDAGPLPCWGLTDRGAEVLEALDRRFTARPAPLTTLLRIAAGAEGFTRAGGTDGRGDLGPSGSGARRLDGPGVGGDAGE